MFAYFVESKTFNDYCPSLSIELNFPLRLSYSNIFEQIYIKISLQ